MDSLAPGDTIDRYRLIAPLGAGGQGTVWRAEDPMIGGAHVALKLVSLHGAPAATVDRFRREARALARLSHPSLPRCHAFFEDLRRDILGFALDLVEGSSLAELSESKACTPTHRFWILSHLARALEFIHEAGLVHRDVKPLNVVVDGGFLAHPEDPSLVKLVDFGIVAEPNNPSPLTAPGGVIGTIEYLAPELLDPGYFHDRSQGAGTERDVFAFGVLAFQLFRGHHPTGLPEGASMGDYIVAYRSEPADESDWPAGVAGDGLEVVYRKCLALRPALRAQDGRQIVALLERARPGAVAGGTVSIRGRGVAALAKAKTEPAKPSSKQTSVTAVIRRTKWPITAIYVAIGGAAFVISFFAAYAGPGEAKIPPIPSGKLRIPPLPPLPTSQEAAGFREEPPNPASPPPPTRPASNTAASATPPPPPAATATATPTAIAAAAARVSCPADMRAIVGPPGFCIDPKEVTVEEYRRCSACGPAKDAFWPGPTFTPDKAAEQTKNCSNNQPGAENKPITCVTWQDAARYCAASGKRLPTMDEWRTARSSITICQNVDRICPLFEWSTDTTRPTYRATRGPSWRWPTTLEGSNLEIARNDDLGFRCAQNPLP